ncbi:MAG TPA: hypothetical protein VHK24_09550, partial [Steroidobacter sp.]|nr:hypothetical protein [Steroidobacter sp.]
MSTDYEPLIKALREMPPPEPRPGFVDRALAVATGVANASYRPRPSSSGLRHAAMRWETWFAAALGGAVAAAITVLLLRPAHLDAVAPGITLALNEARDIDVLIQSDRELQGATIRVAVTGGVALDGFANEHVIDWRADLERGGNLLSLPVVARRAGDGQLVAVIEH